MLKTLSRAYPSGLPEQIRVGPITYNVFMVSSPSAVIGEEEVPLFGSVNFRKSAIEIADDLPDDVTWQCFLHEVLHIFYETIGMRDADEGLIDSLAYLLLGFLLDNGFLVPGEPGKFPALETPRPW